jgi:hypothetical protein
MIKPHRFLVYGNVNRFAVNVYGSEKPSSQALFLKSLFHMWKQMDSCSSVFAAALQHVSSALSTYDLLLTTDDL